MRSLRAGADPVFVVMVTFLKVNWTMMRMGRVALAPCYARGSALNYLELGLVLTHGPETDDMSERTMSQYSFMISESFSG
ncbi:protein of unknown function [Paraburkholderia dioscoreae]|uniref:Uncharacterized protein n=1 Tax=Paraburkholderia dioscoreae TaxID=2604047 RepID=A0A5Q4Z1R9_9BURK|nr:protein of unknown function [Paraburkholderia dioscoreae]